MVGDVFSLKSLEQNLMTSEDFPTAASPAIEIVSSCAGPLNSHKNVDVESETSKMSR